MKINGKERKFVLTIGAVTEISTLCPDGNIDRFSEVFEGSTTKMLTNIAKVAVAMNKYSGDPEPLTLEELMCLTFDEFQKLQNEIVNAYKGGSQTTVKTTPVKKKSTKTVEP